MAIKIDQVDGVVQRSSEPPEEALADSDDTQPETIEMDEIQAELSRVQGRLTAGQGRNEAFHDLFCFRKRWKEEHS